MEKTLGASVRCEGVSYHYDRGADALCDVSFALEPGKFLAILGPNGSGKTTLMGCLAGQLRPGKGNVWIDGENPARLSAKKLAQIMAVVRQQSSIEYAFSVEEIVMMGRNAHHTYFQGESEGDWQIVHDALEKAKITPFAKRPVTALSGGEFQRVLIARAIAQQPRLLLLDEPTASLDIHHQVNILTTVRQFCRERGVTVICILHDLNLAAAYADELMLLSQGKLIAHGSAEEVLTPDILEAVYQVKVQRIAHPMTGQPYIIEDYL